MKKLFIVILLTLNPALHFAQAKSPDKISPITPEEFSQIKSALLNWMTSANEFKTVVEYKNKIDELTKVNEFRTNSAGTIIAFSAWQYHVETGELFGFYKEDEKSLYTLNIKLRYKEKGCELIWLNRVIDNIGVF